MGDCVSERLLQDFDVPAALQLSAQAEWNQSEDDWRTLLDLAPASCLAIEVDGKLAATTTLLCYGRRLGWIGMVLTKTAYRRRGFAKKLLAKALAHSERMGIETVKLDATEQGRPLYEQFGFRYEAEIERWSRPGDGSTQLLPLRADAQPVWQDSDALAFGADRSALLEKLARRNAPVSHSRSYLFARQGRTTAYLGPCVGEDSATVRSLIKDCIRGTSCGWSWDLFSRNSEAVAIARDLGFTPQRHLLRMTRGRNLRARDGAIYAIAGFELG